MKKLVLFLGITGMLFGISSCNKDDIEDLIPSASVSIKDGENSVLEQSFTAVAGAKTGSMITIAAATISGFPAMTVYLSNSETGTREIKPESFISLDFSNIMENTVIIASDINTQYILIKGTINIESSSDKEIKGSFSGAVVDRSALTGLDLAGITNLLLNQKTITGSFKTYSVTNLL